jgi:tight adherence protein B
VATVVEVLAALLAFVAVMGLVVGLVERSRAKASVDRRFASMAARRSPARPEGNDGSDLIRNSVSSMGPIRSILESGAFATGTIRSLERAGLGLKVSEWVMLKFMIGGVLFGFFFLVLGTGLSALFLAVPAFLVGFILLPNIYLGMRTSRRQNAITHQLTEALVLIANAMRSGVAFLQAVKMAASQVPEPMAGELNQFLQDTTLGAPTDDALRALAERCGTTDVELVVTTIIIQRTTGGRLSEVLDRIAETLRERETLNGEIHAMTGQQRLSGNIMAVYPFALTGVFILIAPDIMKVLWQETAGMILVAVALAFQLVAIIWMRMVLRLEV